MASGGGVVSVMPARCFEEFYRTHRDEMARALGLTFRDASMGAEAADEAFTRACQRWADVSGYDNPQGWVFKVALNWGRSGLRRLQREKDRSHLIARPELCEDRPVDVDLERAMSNLSETHRAVIVARFYLNMSVSQIAAAMGVAEGTVKSRLSRSLDRLRYVLDDDPVRL